MATMTLRPNGTGYITELLSYPSGASYECIDEETADEDTTYIYNDTSGSSNLSAVEIEDPSSAVGYITKVKFYARCRKINDSAVCSVELRIRTHSTVYAGSGWLPITTSYANYSYEWANNPYTGTNWIWSEITNLQIIPHLRNYGATESRCTQCYLEVHYNMGRTAGAGSKVYIDEFNFSGSTNAVNPTFDVNLPEVTAFSDSGAEFVEGKINSKATINGFFDPTDDAYDEQMFALIGDNAKHYVGLYMGNDASYSDIGYEIQGQVSSQERPIEVAGAALLHCSVQGEGGVVRSTVLCNGAVTASGAVTNSNQNWGTTTSGTTFVGILRVLSVTGSGSITVEIEESSDDGAGDAYSQIIAFTAKTAVGVERKTITTATEAYKRVNVTAFSGFSTVTIMVVIGKEQGT